MPIGILNILLWPTNYLSLAGGALTGDVQQSTLPINGNSLINKSYADNLFTGLSWKQEVTAGTTENITLSGAQTVDGIVVSAGDRVLVKNQTTAISNGIYQVAAGTWTRTIDADTSTEIGCATVLVKNGNINKNTQWTCINSTDPIVGTDNIAFGQISGAGTYTNGTGISLAGNVFSLDTMYADNIYLKYTGATGDVNIGLHEFTAGAIRGADINASTGFYAGSGTYSGALEALATTMQNSADGSFAQFKSNEFLIKDIASGYTTYISVGVNTQLSNANIIIPSKSGVLALTSDIPSLAEYVPYEGSNSDIRMPGHGIYAEAFYTTGVGGHTITIDGSTTSSNDWIGIFPAAGSYVEITEVLRVDGTPINPTDVVRLIDLSAYAPISGSANYIQNLNNYASPQPSSNISIDTKMGIVDGSIDIITDYNRPSGASISTHWKYAIAITTDPTLTDTSGTHGFSDMTNFFNNNDGRGWNSYDARGL
ncbi:MAG TPA: hypothetical protein VIM55_05325 [Mucilaginibacter sp.]